MSGKPQLEQWQVNRVLVLKSHQLSNRLIAKRMRIARTTVDRIVQHKYKCSDRVDFSYKPIDAMVD